MTQFALAVWIFSLGLGASAVLALVWAISSGQFRSFRAGAESIFDEEEPIGEVTDHFPPAESPRSPRSVDQEMDGDRS